MITEGGDLPSMLSIIKYGQNEPDISFRVTITEATPLNEMGNNYYLILILDYGRNLIYKNLMSLYRLYA